jgi:hypothetical protein
MRHGPTHGRVRASRLGYRIDLSGNERRAMRTFLNTLAVVLAAAISITAASGVSASAAAKCGSGIGPTKYSTTETIKGKSVVVNCGPATAKLRYKGKTYTFAHGTCFRYLGSFKLNLGSSLLIPSKSTGGYASMTLTGTPSSQIEVGAGFGKVSLYAPTKSSGIATKGTFTSSAPSEPFTGSWNCGGPIQKH